MLPALASLFQYFNPCVPRVPQARRVRLGPGFLSLMRVLQLTFTPTRPGRNYVIPLSFFTCNLQLKTDNFFFPRCPFSDLSSSCPSQLLRAKLNHLCVSRVLSSRGSSRYS